MVFMKEIRAVRIALAECGLPRFLSVLPRAAPFQRPQHEFREAEIREGRLDQVNADETGEREPPRIEEMVKREARQDEGAGKNAKA
jgi:hypothetical protein